MEVKMDMIERVARAFCTDGGLDPDEMMPNDGPRWRYYDTLARAAIEAMQDENDRLRSALNDIDVTAEFFVQDGVSADAMRGGHYMIRSKVQAALGPQVND
jgi:hypothetical protein